MYNKFNFLHDFDHITEIIKTMIVTGVELNNTEYQGIQRKVSMVIDIIAHI